MITTMRPALTPDEWCHRRSGPVFLDIVDDEVHVVVADPDEQLVSVTGPNDLHALLALANDALPADDPRRLTGTDLAVLSILIDRLDRTRPNTHRLIALSESLFEKIAALLPPH